MVEGTPYGWEPEVAELARRRALAAELGGPERVARARAQGKLTVRERLDLLADKGSFRESGALVGDAVYEGDELIGFTPKPVVHGTCTIDGRKVVVVGNDFTVRGGSGTGHSMLLGQEPLPASRALSSQLPLVKLLDSAGGSIRSVDEIGRTYLPDGNTLVQDEMQLLDVAPVVSAVMGPVAGGPAVNACTAHFSVMVDKTSCVFVAGPPVVRAATGAETTKEELGGADVHARVSGVIDNLAQDEKDALEQVRRFLSYLPSNVHQLPPRGSTSDPVDRRDEALLGLVPRNPRQPHDMHRLIDSVVDVGSFFEIAPLYGAARITGLARVNGYPVGIMANNPMQGAGATNVAGAEKALRIMQLCDTFHLPLVSFADEPGFLVGHQSEADGIERTGARLAWMSCRSRMPWITFVIRRLYGVAGQVQHRPTGMYRRYAWPSARWGSIPIEGGVLAAYKSEIDAADDPVAARREIEQRLQRLTSPFRTAEVTGQDIIDPRDTRLLLAEFVEDAQHVLATQLGPPAVPYRP
jgi:acetyl-CoA carboxylase carboxyltransferase component